MTGTEKRKLEGILSSLEGRDNVFVLGCGDCATLMQTGGEHEVAEMAEALAEAGKTVTGTAVPDVGCKVLDIKRLLREHKDQVQAAEALLVLSCGAGVQAAAEAGEMYTIPGLDTVGQVDQLRLGQFFEWCSSCGECVVGDFGGVCPLTRCPKGQMHGPCGGSDEGKCEVDPEQACVWAVIYERRDKGVPVPAAAETATAAPRDYRKASGPRRRVFEPRRGG